MRVYGRGRGTEGQRVAGSWSAKEESWPGEQAVRIHIYLGLESRVVAAGLTVSIIASLNGCGGEKSPFKDLEAVDKKGHWVLRIKGTEDYESGCTHASDAPYICWVNYWLTYRCGWRHEVDSTSTTALDTVLHDLELAGKSKWLKYGKMAFQAGMWFCPELAADYKLVKVGGKVAKTAMKIPKVAQFFDDNEDSIKNLFHHHHDEPPPPTKINPTDKYSNISCDSGEDFGRVAMMHQSWYYGDTLYVYQWVQTMKTQNTTTNQTFTSEVWTEETRAQIFAAGDTPHPPCCLPGQFAGDDFTCKDGTENLCQRDSANSDFGSNSQHTGYAVDISDLGQVYDVDANHVSSDTLALAVWA